MGLQTATNSSTGETAVLVDGAWSKVDQVASNPQGQKAYLVGGKWLTDDGATPPPAARPDPKTPTAFEKEAQETLGVSTPDLIAANPVTRMATSAAMPVLGTAARVENLWGGHTNQDRINSLKEMQARGNKALGLGAAGATADVAGAVVGPGGLSTKLPAAATLPGRVAQGAELGGLLGLTSGNEDSLETGGVGAVIGGTIPAAAKLIGKVGEIGYHGLIEPWAAPAAIKGRAYLDAAGDKWRTIRDLLVANRERVPGSAPTAGEAAVPAGRAEFSALQESAKRVAPSDYLARSDSQNAARREAIGSIAGDDATMAAAKAERQAAAGPSYEAGTSQPNHQSMEGLAALSERPSMQSALNRARDLAKEQGREFPLVKGQSMFDKRLTGDDAQTLKLAFDDMIKHGSKSGIETKELDAMRATRSEYITWMEGQFPDLKTARAAYKAGSEPINQMEVGQELKRKLTPALDDEMKLRANVFSEAVRNAPRTLKSATGEPRFTEMDQVLTPRQQRSVSQVKDDLANQQRHEDMARRGSAAAPNAIDLATRNLEEQAGGKIPNILHRGAMLANAIITRLEGKVNRTLASEMAAEMLNPPKVGEAISAAKVREARNKFMAEQIMKGQRLATAGGVGLAQQQGE